MLQELSIYLLLFMPVFWQDHGFDPPLWISTDFSQWEFAEVLTRRLTNEKSLYIFVQKIDVI